MSVRQRQSEMARREQMRRGEVRAVGVGKTRMVGRDGEARETQSEPERRVAQQARARRTVGNTSRKKREKVGPQLPDLHKARRGGLYRRYEIVIYAQSELKRKDKMVTRCVCCRRQTMRRRNNRQ
jgi:hypothetical protein